jgi:membrane protein DedA with SNARE-associated domain
MFFSPSELLSLLGQYKYWVIFPIAVVEGPIIMIISGFLVNLGVLNAFIAYSVLVVADVLGDTVYYFIGRYWRKTFWVKKLMSFFGYDETTELYLEEHFRKHKFRTFLIGKFTHGIGGMIEIASGIAGMRFWEYLFISFVTTMPKALVLVSIGYYAGIYYEKINGYFQNFAFITIGAVLIFVFFTVSKKLKADLLSKRQK